MVPASLLVTAGFAAIFIQRENRLSSVSLSYGAVFLALCFAGHVFLRVTLPYADPYLFPLAAALSAIGLVMIYRINDALARQQAQWFVVALILFAATILWLRDYRVLERYRYTIAAAGVLLLMTPRLPVVGEQVNGAYLNLKLGPVAFQPAELAKIAIVVFLASYLRSTARRCMRTRRITATSTTRRLRERSSRRPPRSTRPRTNSSATPAAMSCQQSFSQRVSCASACARPRRAWTQSAPPRRSPSRARAQSA